MPKKRKSCGWKSKPNGKKIKTDNVNAAKEEKEDQLQVPLCPTTPTQSGARRKRKEAISAGSVVMFVRASRSQNSIRYSPDSRNRQCTANAAVALAYSNLIPFTNWNTAIMDNILDYGDQLYKKSISNRRMPGSSELLFVIELFPDFVIDNVYYHLEIREDESISGQIDQYAEIGGEMDVRLPYGLPSIFRNFSMAIFTCGLESIAVSARSNFYYIFDSHSRGLQGNGIEEGGKACLLRFRSIDRLIVYLQNNYNRGQLYTLVPIEVRVDSVMNRIEACRQYPKFKVYDSVEQFTKRRSNAEPINNLERQIETACDDLPEMNVVNNNVDRQFDIVQLNNLGKMDQECIHCNALFFINENKNCCKYGSISFPSDTVYPELLKALITDMHPLSKEFIKSIRRYNTLLAMGSTTFEQREGLRGGAPVIVVSGQIHHRVADVVPSNPSFGSLYFIDSGEATRRRMTSAVRGKCNENLLAQIDTLLRDIHPFARVYQTLGQMVRQAQETGGNDAVSEVGLYFHEQPETNRKIHAAPTITSEIGAVFRTIDGDIPPPSAIRVSLINSDTQQGNGFQINEIPRLSPIVDALCYPLLFPNGELGWSTDLRQTIGGKRVTLRDFELYRMMCRKNTLNPSLLCGKLTQQFIVDKYVQLEGMRLHYLRTHQAKLRAENYAGLQDFVAQKINGNRDEQERVGRIVILPSTFAGSVRFMQQNYQDAMAIVAKFGRPSLFITFTCNPNWPEIRDNMGSNLLNPQDRPDIIGRVFELKRKEFFIDILIRNIFGKVIAYVYVIEYQKRGLPHMHCLLFLDDKDKLREPEDVDNIISAELPKENTRLFEIVTSSMIHGPCGDRNQNSVCMVDGQCSKHYPKSFANATSINRAIATYKRTNDGRTVTITRNRTSYVIDNRDVVPYSSYLLLKYNSHINVEAVTSIGSIKYVFKYINKGPDAAVIQVRDELIFDEIHAFIESRYISSCEAAWRLLAYPIQGKSHTVYRLIIHLPGERVVYFSEGEEEAALQQPKKSCLEAYFQLNVNDSTARHLKYCEVPLHYSFVPGEHRWKKRAKKCAVIPRMYTISPKYVEKFHLRILLLHVAGPTSFEDLRTYNGTTYETFQEAVRARGLTATDEEWVKTLQHAALVDMPGCMRKLFAYMLCFCEISDTRSLWHNFKNYMCEDYRRKNYSISDSENLALNRIERILRFLGRTLRDFHLPEPSTNVHIDVDDVEDESDGTVLENVSPDNLNTEQRRVFDSIVAAIESTTITEDRCFYLQGSGGTGKTHLYNVLLDYCEKKKQPTLAVAYTGIAALLLKNGRTVHSTFRLPLNLDSNSRSAISAQSEEAAGLRKIELIIWDEVSMSNYHVLNVVDELLQDVCNNQRPFGGKCILLGGDVKQLLPVAPGRVEQVELFFTNCRAWKHFRIFQLKTNMRASNGQDEFIDWLENLGNGTVNKRIKTKKIESDDFASLPERCLTTNVVQKIYGTLNDLTPTEIAKRAILCPRNDHCNKLNDTILNAFNGDLITINSNDSIASGDINEITNFPEEFLNSITPSGMPLHELKLKVGIPVLLLRNLSLKDGLINGTRLLIINITDVILTAEIVTGRFAGRRVLIPKMDLTSSDPKMPFTLKRRQFPIKVCFALTINKAQGQTFEQVGIYLPTPVFSHGQLYVAFSRGRSFESIYVEVEKTNNQGQLLSDSADIFTKNIVYGNILKSITAD